MGPGNRGDGGSSRVVGSGGHRTGLGMDSASDRDQEDAGIN